MMKYLRSRIKTVLFSEAIFFVLFVGWLFYKAHVPDITHTEQPMDLALLNATIVSPHYPPNDPWLAGHSISYYYFGYLILGSLSLLTGVVASVTYNLGLVTFASLSGLAAFGVVYNLVRLSNASELAARLTGIAAVFLLLIASNLEGVLELVRAAGVGGSGFWEFVSVERLSAPSGPSGSWAPEGFWWWFRASRIFDITEFPLFSFLLGDLHPHVMSIVFVILSVSIGIQLFLMPRLLALTWIPEHWPLAGAIPLIVGALAAINLWDLPLGVALVGGAVILNAVRHPACDRLIPMRLLLIGASGFIIVAPLFMSLINDWEWLLTLTLVGVAVLLACLLILSSVNRIGHGAWAPVDVLAFGVTFGCLAFVMYAPFYFSFASEAAGILPQREVSTRPVHLFLVWGSQGFLTLLFLAVVTTRMFRSKGELLPNFGLALVFGFLPLILWLQPIWGIPAFLTMFLTMAVAYYVTRRFESKKHSLVRRARLIAFFLAVILFITLLVDGFYNANGISSTSISVTSRMLVVLPLSVLLSLTIGNVLVLACSLKGQIVSHARPVIVDHAPILALGLLAIGLGLILGPELFHIADTFGRINTVFKLYFQAWIILSLAGAYALYYIFSCLGKRTFTRRLGIGLFALILVGMLASLSYYPVAATYSRANGQTMPLTLDGQRYLNGTSPAEYAAIQMIRNELPRDAVVLEGAVVSCDSNKNGCSDFTDVGRIASSTGRPTIVGWKGHERQWGRSIEMLNTRQEEVRRIYQTTDLYEAIQILAKYDVDYVVAGPRERRVYGKAGLVKFDQLGVPIFRAGSSSASLVIYKVELP